jgi:hypothetical protein
MNLKTLFFIFSTAVLALPLQGQNQCAEAISAAEDKYQEGKLYDIPPILSECLENGFTKEEKVRAYRLLTLSYLFLDYEKEADESYLKLLSLSPEYKVNEETDPSELINHHYKFTTKPIFYLNPLKIGFNFSMVNVTNEYSLSSPISSPDKYSTEFGFDAGFGAEMVLYQNLHLAAEFLITGETFHQQSTHWGFYITNMDYSFVKFQIPIMLKYNFFRGKINPFALAGVSPVYVSKTSIKNLEGVYRVATDVVGEYEEFPVQPRPPITTTALRTQFNYSLLFGGGINYKIGLNYLVFEARYNFGMMNMVKTENRWREDFTEGRELKFPSGHVDDDFKLNNISFFVGFVKPLYKPRKIK